MSWTEYLIVLGCCVVTMLLCRCLPLFVLKGKELSPTTKRVLSYIPPAAFAALVANDLFSMTMFEQGIWAGCIPLIAALIVVVVARKTDSLIACAVVGVVVYALLSLI